MPEMPDSTAVINLNRTERAALCAKRYTPCVVLSAVNSASAPLGK